MKKQVILTCLLGMTGVCAMAQLEVDSLGNVGIRTIPYHDYSLSLSGLNHTTALDISSVTNNGINISNMHGGYGIYIKNYNEDDSGACGIYIRPRGSHSANTSTYGVSSIAGDSQTLNIGVWGGVKQGSNNATVYGAGVFGTASNISGINSAYMGIYAGYFRGDVRVVDGTLYGSLITPSANSSSAVADISSLSGSARSADESVSDRLSQVSLFQFQREPQVDAASEAKSKRTVSSEDVDEEMEDEEMEDEYVPGTHLASVQYGLAADQLREVFPELVYEDRNGNVSINYIEMIPVLVQANNELRARVAALEAEKEKVVQQPKSLMASAASLPIGKEMKEETLMLSLGQNNPNPFSEQTSIEVCVPEAVAAAALLIFDMQGKQVKKIDIDARGTSRITVTGQGLTEGMYLYSLIADGKVVQTKKMILSK